MIEIIATIASLLGLHVRDLLAMVRRLQQQSDAALSDEIRVALIQADRAITRYGLASQLLIEYYRDHIENAGLIYSYSINNESNEIAVLTKPEWIGLAIPAENIRCKYCSIAPPNLGIAPKKLEQFVAQVIHRQTILDYRLWDAPTYRITAVTSNIDELDMTLGISSFLQYKYTYGAVREEIRQAFMDADIEKAIESNAITNYRNQSRLIASILNNRDQLMPFRALILPNGKTLISFNQRAVVVGTNVILAIRRPEPNNDYAFVIQRRSLQVSEGPGLLHVVPAGFHQPALDIICEMNPINTVYRELYEELFGGDEAITTSKRLRADWFYETSQPMKFLRDNKDFNRLECVCMGVGLPSGVFELGFLYVIEHPDFWKRYSHHMRGNWEVTKALEPFVSSRNSKLLKILLNRRDWSESGHFAMVEALKRLKKTTRDMVEVDLH